MTHRVIARLDIKGSNLVKGVQLEGLRVLGKPEDFARLYYESGADELLYMDIVASLYERNSLHDIIRRTARETFIPLTVGGGIRSLDDIRTVLRAGADKVALNTAAIKNPPMIRQAAEMFGSSTIVVSIEAKRQPNGQYEAYIENGRQKTGREVYQWAREAVGLGAGEVMITSIDREGTGLGFDLDLTRGVADIVGVPVVAGGGAGRQEDVLAVFTSGRADAVSLASLLHYNALRNNQVAGPNAAGGSPFSQRTSSKIQDRSLPDLKSFLAGHDISVRTVYSTHSPASERS